MTFVVFTDLDGTLLDHRTYGFRMALPALDMLLRRNVPVVPVTSKTSDEVRWWMGILGLKGPFAYENGSGIIIPEGYFPGKIKGASGHKGGLRISTGREIGDVRNALRNIAVELGLSIRAYGDMSSDEITAATGLQGKELENSKRREFDEPFLVNGDYDHDDFVNAAAARGMTAVRGGRFHHLLGDCDKGKTVRFLMDLFRRKDGNVISIGIGDSENDMGLFQSVDRPFLVQRPDGTYSSGIPEDEAERVAGPGPAGWRMAVEGFVSNAIN